MMAFGLYIFTFYLTSGISFVASENQTQGPHQAKIFLDESTLEAINCEGTGFIHIVKDSIAVKCTGGPFFIINMKDKQTLFGNLSDTCNGLPRCSKNNTEIKDYLKKKECHSSGETELDVDFLCSNGSANFERDGSPSKPTENPQNNKQRYSDVIGSVVAGFAIFTIGIIFACAVLYIKNNYHERKTESELNDLDYSAYAEIDYGQMSSASITPEPPLPPTAVGTPHPHLMPLQYYSTARELGASGGPSRRESSRRKLRASSKKRRCDHPPNFLPPDPEAQSNRLFRLRSPPKSFKKNVTVPDTHLSEIDDTLLEENCVYDFGGASDNHKESPPDFQSQMY